MKVTDIKVHLVRSNRNTEIPSPWIFVQVFTDEGVVGIGDATNWPGGTIIKQAIEELSRFVIGEDPFNIEYIYHLLYHALQQIGQTGAVIAAISGIEIALWDIVGQVAGQPIYNLLGGSCRDRVRFYSHAGEPEECARLAEKGCTAIKAYFPGGTPRPGERINIPCSITLKRGTDRASTHAAVPRGCRGRGRYRNRCGCSIYYKCSDSLREQIGGNRTVILRGTGGTRKH